MRAETLLPERPTAVPSGAEVVGDGGDVEWEGVRPAVGDHPAGGADRITKPPRHQRGPGRAADGLDVVGAELDAGGGESVDGVAMVGVTMSPEPSTELLHPTSEYPRSSTTTCRDQTTTRSSKSVIRGAGVGSAAVGGGPQAWLALKQEEEVRK